MNESKISVRYARALFLTAKDSNVLDQVKTDMFLISEVLKDNETFLNFLNSPVTKPSALRKVIQIAFGDGKVHPITLNFLGLLVQNNRIQYLAEIALVFFSTYRKNKGIKSAKLLTANILDDSYRNRFQKVLEDIYKAEIELSVNTNNSIIGGFVLTVEDQQYDASISTQLQKLKKSLLTENLK